MIKRKLKNVATVLMAMGVVAAAGAHRGLAATTTDNTQPIQSRVVYGINSTSGHLLRYDFTKSKFSDVGAITNQSGQVLTGINAGAYVPGCLNMFAFWKSPTDSQTHLEYVNLRTAKAAAVGQSLGSGEVTGAAAVAPPAGSSADTPWPCYAVQTASSAAPVDFHIDGDSVVTNQTVAAKATILGAAITYGGQYTIPVTVEMTLAGKTFQPFGSFTSASSGNVNDGKNPRSYVFPDTFPAGSHIDVKARSWIKQSSWGGGTTWSPYLTVDSSTDSKNVIVLRNGDAVPNITPFMNQGSIVSFVKNYVDSSTHRIKLQANQAIYLFELGTTDLQSSAADFQDLVVLVTMAKDASELQGSTSDATPANLIKVDMKTGAAQTVMPLSRVYDSLTSLDGKTFYATSESGFYLIDTATKSETKLGTLAWSQMPAMAYAGSQLTGFETSGDTLEGLMTNDGASLAAFDIGMSDLGTMVYVTPANDPANMPPGYD